MATKTSAQALANWVAGMGGAAKAYTDGINGTTVNPMALAAAPDAMSRYVANTARAAQPGGKMVTGLQAADPNFWKTQCVQGGAQRLASGATKGKAKYQRAVNTLAPIWAQQQAAVNSMPKGGLANAQARASAAIAIMMQATGRA